MVETPPLILHHHIFKNAGMSIDYSLKKYFGNSWSALEGAHARDIVSESDLWGFIKDRPTLSAISSHTLRPIAHAKNIFPIVFIRHPVLRARSVYLFTKKDKTQPNHKEISSQTFPEFIEWALSSEPKNGGVVIKNYQVIHLSSASFRVPCILDAQATAIDLIQAEDFLMQLPAYGIVENFEISIKNYEFVLNKFFKGIKFENVRLNSTSNLVGGMIDELKIIRNEIGSNCYNDLIEANSFDLALYESACNHFQYLLSQSC